MVEEMLFALKMYAENVWLKMYDGRMLFENEGSNALWKDKK